MLFSPVYAESDPRLLARFTPFALTKKGSLEGFTLSSERSASEGSEHRELRDPSPSRSSLHISLPQCCHSLATRHSPLFCLPQYFITPFTSIFRTYRHTSAPATRLFSSISFTVPTTPGVCPQKRTSGEDQPSDKLVAAANRSAVLCVPLMAFSLFPMETVPRRGRSQ